jgi:hypothetical protein
MAYKAKNNAYSTLAGPLTAADTLATVQAGHGDRFPVIAGADYTLCTIEDAAGRREIIKVTTRAAASDTFTIERGQEGTTALSWGAGDSIELRMTAKLVEDAMAHSTDDTDAHAASAITFTPAGSIAADNVQEAIEELDTEKSSLSYVNTQLALKANSADVTTQLATKASNTELANTNAAVALKAPLASPSFTGVPAAVTAAADTNTTQLATTAFVQERVNRAGKNSQGSKTVEPISAGVPSDATGADGDIRYQY